MTLRIRDLPSSNQDERPGDTPIDMLILHYTGMRGAQEAIDRLRDPAARVSSHYVVDEDGSRASSCAGGAARLARRGYLTGADAAELNARSIGIEIVNPGHEWGYRDFPVLQLAAVCDLCLAILSRHPIPARNMRRAQRCGAGPQGGSGGEYSTGGAWQRTASALWPQDVPDLGTTGRGARSRLLA